MMAQHSIRPRLLDILQSIDIVKAGIASRKYESFQADVILRLAVERAIEKHF
jgi:uncharacterized protein with HEPN domain